MENFKGDKDLLMWYKIYLQTINFISKYGNKYGDEEVKKVLESRLPENLHIKLDDYENKRRR